MNWKPKQTPLPLVLLALALLVVQAAWCAVVPSLSTPTPLNNSSIPSATDWNDSLQAACNYLNNSVVAALNQVTVKGATYVYNGSSLTSVSPSSNGQVMVADDTTAAGIKWATYTGETAVTTKGDLEVTDGSTIARLPIGANATTLGADSTQAYGMNWSVATNDNFPTGAVSAWSPTGAGTTVIPTGWLVCDGTSGTPNLIGLFIVGTRPNGSSSTPSSGGYGVHTADTKNGSLTHTHSSSGSILPNAGASTLPTKMNAGTKVVASSAHDHAIFASAGCTSTQVEPSDYVLIYLVKQ